MMVRTSLEINQEFKFRNNPTIKRRGVIGFSYSAKRNEYLVERKVFKETINNTQPEKVDLVESDGFYFRNFGKAKNKFHQQLGYLICKWPKCTIKY